MQTSYTLTTYTYPVYKDIQIEYVKWKSPVRPNPFCSIATKLLLIWSCISSLTRISLKISIRNSEIILNYWRWLNWTLTTPCVAPGFYTLFLAARGRSILKPDNACHIRKVRFTHVKKTSLHKIKSKTNPDLLTWKTIYVYRPIPYTHISHWIHTQLAILHIQLHMASCTAHKWQCAYIYQTHSICTY